MSSRFTELAIDCHEPQKLAEFWCAVLGWRVNETGPGLVEITGDEPGPTIVFARVPEPKTVKNRVHVDVNPRDREQDEEVERILALGASRVDVGQGDDATWAVLADPEGNEFCVLRTRRP